MYRLIRNPMYVAVLAWVAGWSLLAGSRWLSLYTLYRAGVNRWWPKA